MDGDRTGCVVDTHRLVLFPSADRVVGLETVLFQELFSVSDLYVEERITHAEELVGHGDGEQGCARVTGWVGEPRPRRVGEPTFGVGPYLLNLRVQTVDNG